MFAGMNDNSRRSRPFFEGVSKGVVNFLPGSGRTAGAQLTKHNLVDEILFTGSAEVGLGIKDVAVKAERHGRAHKHVIARCHDPSR